MTDELEEDLQDLLLALVAVDSQNPSLVGGADGEGAIADLVTGWAARAGLDVERIEPTPGRPSLLVTAHGTAPADTPSLLLCGHLDTVGIGAAGLVPHVEGDQVHGRGAYDMKGGVAAALVAMREAVHRRAAAAFYQAGELLDAAPLAADVGEAVEQLVEELAHPLVQAELRRQLQDLELLNNRGRVLSETVDADQGSRQRLLAQLQL